MAVGSIEIDILANTAKLVKGMNRAEKTVKKSITNMTRTVGTFAAIFVSGAMIGKINATAAGLNKIGKTSSKLGITAEALQGLHLGAEEAGISTNTLDMAIQRMTRRVSEAARGTGEAVGALNELNISAEELAKLTPDEMLKRVADSMADVTSQSDRVRLSMKLFDSEGVAMVNMLSKGSKGLDDTAAKAEKLGLIISGDYIKAIERSSDAWNISSKIMDTVWKGITVGLSVSLTQLVEDLNKGTGKINVFSKSLDITKQVVYSAGRGFEILTTSISTAIAGYELLAAAINLFNGIEGRDKSEALERYNAAMAQSISNSDAWIAAIMGTSEASLSLKRILETSFTGLDSEKIISDQNRINDNISNQTTLWSEVGAAADAYYTNLTNKTTTAKSLVSSMNTTISSGITGAFRQAMDGATSFGDVFQNILKDVIAKLIETLFIQVAVAAALKGLGFNVTTGTASAGTVTVGGAGAQGGIIKNGSSFLVGEDGPEIVNLPRGANIIPNGETSTGGVTAVNVNVINNAGVDVGVNEDSEGQIEIIISKITNDIRRGTGTLGGALESRYNLSKA